MGVHPFQISDLNWNFIAGSPVSSSMGSFASENAIMPDNVNASASRYLKLQAVWSDVAIGPTTVTNDSFGQPTGQNNNFSSSNPCRPNGGYFVRGLYFTNTAAPTNDSTGPFRVGYIGSFVGGLLNCDYTHDSNGTTVDYEPIYSHAAATFPMVASQAKQWRDPVNPPADGTDLVINSGSALTRSIYMPPAYQIMFIDSAGSNTLGSGLVSFHVESRPTLHMAGFNDNINQGQPTSPAWCGAGTPPTGGGYSYTSDPISNYNNLAGNSANSNFHEMYQVTGVRKLNSRGLSFHLAKFHDNGSNAYAYPYEEDGITLGTNVLVGGGGNSITYPYTYVNDRQEYTWAGGRDVGASILFTANSGTVLTVTTTPVPTPYTTGTILLLQGLTAANYLNGTMVTVLAGATTNTFTANFTHASYSATADNGVVVSNPDFRIRNAATFIINEEYYGTVADTKCAIWSNKSSMIPLIFFDLADTWSASAAKRIAGVAVVPVFINATGAQSWQVFFLAEDGKLAVYDFTQTNGVLSLITAAPAVVAAGEAYGALRARSTSSTITNVAITSNVLTITATNTFEAGEIVNLTGLTTATFLNNQTVTISTIVGGGTGFTASYTHANYTSAADTGTAVGYSLWALYGTMTGDPRLTQSGLTNDANINVFRYLIGSAVWGSANLSPNKGRHNGRSLQEMIIARDGKLYMLVEDTTSSAGFIVSNSFVQTFPSGPFNINWQVMAYDPIAAAWNASKINGSTLLQYGTNFGCPPNNTFSESRDFWFQSPNAFLHDIGTNQIMIQPNWTVGPNNGTTGPTAVGLQILDVSGSTSALTNANLTTLQRGSFLPNDAIIGGGVEPATTPVSIVHSRDFATNGERTILWVHDILRQQSGTMTLYLAPPSFNWASPTATQQIVRNSYPTGNPQNVGSFQKDFMSYSFMGTTMGSFTVRFAWEQPTMLMDNYLHFVFGATNADGLPNGTYGRSFAQSFVFIPTYWKWTGSAWALADTFANAAANPRLISAANTNIPLPYGLQVQFGPASGTSYTFGEFQTFNMAWGNTKFARKMRQSYAQFAGQTFTNVDTRTIASQNALSMFLIDTDLGSVTTTAPTSATPQTATLTPTPLGWITQTTWPKLDGANAGFDATPFQIVWNVNTGAFNNATFTNPPAANVSGTNSTPYNWTVGAITYQVQASGEQNPSGNPAWNAVAGNPQTWWQSNTGNTGTLAIDLGLGNAQTVLTYGFRPLFTSTDLLDGTTPKSWTLEGSNTSLTSGFSVVDTRSNITPTTRSVAYTCNGTTASYRYYRMNISATQNNQPPTLSMLRLNTAAFVNTVNFNEMVFYAYGSQVSPTYHYDFIRNWQMCRGIKLETSTNGGVSYTPVFEPGVTPPLWRALNGYVWTFPRQTAVTNVRLTVQHGYNYATGTNSVNVPLTTGFGPFYFIDYGVSQATIDAARLGNSLSAVGTPTIGSFDPNCLGIAVDVPNISVDGGNPSLLTASNLLVDTAVHGFWDFNYSPDATHGPAGQPGFKLHPFFGFVFFQGAGGSGGVSTQTGTNAVINYQWGRRV